MNPPPKVIKTDAEHAAATVELTRLMDLDPPPGTSDADRLELLAVLIETYEKARFPIIQWHYVWRATRVNPKQAGQAVVGVKKGAQFF